MSGNFWLNLVNGHDWNELDSNNEENMSNQDVDEDGYETVRRKTRSNKKKPIEKDDFIRPQYSKNLKKIKNVPTN